MKVYGFGLPLVLAISFTVPALSSGGLAHAQAVPREWALGAAPSLAIGGGGRAETEFFRVNGVWRLSDGRIVVVNGSSKEIRVFDARGAWLHSFGREGEGPGEFRALGWTTNAGDTAFVYDGDLRRITTIHLGGTPSLLDVRPITVKEEKSFDVVGRLADGRWLVHSLSPPNVSAPGVQRVPGFAGLIDGTATGTVGWLAEQPDLSLFIYNPAGSRKMVSVVVAAFPSSFAMAASGRVVWFGDDGAALLVKVDAATGTRTTIRLPDSPAPLTKALVDAARKDEIEATRDQASRDAVLVKYSARYLPKRLPAFEALVPGPGGELWVRRFTPGRGAPGKYVVLSPDGRVLGRVTVPSGFRVNDAGPDYVLGVYRDEEGVETVRAYTLTRR